MNLQEEFDKYDGEYSEFERIENKLSNHPDIHAFILLNRLMPTEENEDIISGADHDIIYLNVDLDKLAEVVKPEEVLELVRCGVWYNTDCESLSMWV